jgi:hypothetical protein
MGEWCIDPYFLDLGNSLRWVLSFTPRSLYPQGKSPRYPFNRRLVDPRTGLDDVEKRKFLTLPGLELRALVRPARSQSLYRLSYPVSRYREKRNFFYIASEGNSKFCKHFDWRYEMIARHDSRIARSFNLLVEKTHRHIIWSFCCIR